MLKSEFPDPGRSVRATQEVVPWLQFATPEIVLCADGSLLAGFAFEPIDLDNADDDRVSHALDRNLATWAQLDNRFTAWVVVHKRRVRSYSYGHFCNQRSADLDNEIGATYLNGGTYEIKRYMFFSYTGQTGVFGYMDNVSRLINEEGKPLPLALVGALFGSMSQSQAAMHDEKLLKANIKTFTQNLTMLANATQGISLKQLSVLDGSFTEALSRSLNVTVDAHRAEMPVDALLDSWIPREYMHVGNHLLRFDGAERTRYGSVVGVKEWPPVSTPKLVETALAADGELTMCMIVRFMDRAQSRKAVNDVREYYKMTLHGLMGFVMKKLNPQSAEAPNEGRLDLLRQCERALARIESSNQLFCHHNFSILVLEDSADGADDAALAMTRRLQNAKFAPIIERMNVGPSFTSMLPGQWATQSRYILTSLESAMYCAPWFGFRSMENKHPYFSEVFHKDVPSMTVLLDRLNGPAPFNPHVGQVGHALVVAPTGGGKTTFVNLCLSQFQRYFDDRHQQPNTIIFDRNYSCRITTELHGGTHIDIGDKALSLNPLALLKNPTTERTLWVREWVIRRIEDSGYKTNAEDRGAVDNAIELLTLSTQDIRLSTLAINLPAHLRMALSEWLEGHPYGMFDNTEDNFQANGWTCIEMKPIMSVDRLCRAFLDYSLFQIMEMMDGRPTFIYLEESAFILSHPDFSKVVLDYLATIRKKGGFVWLTMQSIDSVLSSDVRGMVVDNVPTKILLSNPSAEAHRAHYKEFFALEDRHVDMIKDLALGEYLIVQANHSRIYRTALTRKSLAYLRSEEQLQRLFSQHKNSGSADWRDRYIQDVASGR
jgi:type IV secretion system protein VirB4